ncbi:hypothetical protein BDW68DRAFT_179988 [Aspergillus falconensis]
MAAHPTSAPVDDKSALSAEHHEVIDRKNDTTAPGQNEVSGYETLGLWEAMKKFKMTTFICFMMCFSAATDGYQVNMHGNIIANPGFVKQFATKVNAAGTPFLEAPVLSAWSAIQSVGQIIGMASLAFITDRFGRKISMYWY